MPANRRANSFQPAWQRWVAGVAVLASGAAFAGEGLRINPEQVPWPTFQARLGVSTGVPTAADTSGSSVQAAQVMGDYFFAPSTLFGLVPSGGFRATSGVMLGSRATALATPTLTHSGMSSLNFSGQRLSLNNASAGASADNSGAIPYLGVGYSGLSRSAGWSFTADLGVVAATPAGNGLHFGRNSNAGSLDDQLRDLRLRPVVQVGVTHPF